MIETTTYNEAGYAWRIKHKWDDGRILDHPASDPCSICDPPTVKAQGPSSGVGSVPMSKRPITRNADANETTREIDSAGAVLGAILSKAKDLKVSSPDPAVVHFLAHSNLQDVIDYLVGTIEILNRDVAKAITDLSNSLSPAIDTKLEDLWRSRVANKIGQILRGAPAKCDRCGRW